MVHIIFKCFSDIWKLDIWDHCFYSLSIHCNSEGQIYLFKYILYSLCLLIFVLLYVIQVLVWMITKMYVMLGVLVFVYIFHFFYYMFYVFYFENKEIQTPYLMETYFSLITGLFYFFEKCFIRYILIMLFPFSNSSQILPTHLALCHFVFSLFRKQTGKPNKNSNT